MSARHHDAAVLRGAGSAGCMLALRLSEQPRAASVWSRSAGTTVRIAAADGRSPRWEAIVRRNGDSLELEGDPVRARRRRLRLAGAPA